MDNNDSPDLPNNSGQPDPRAAWDADLNGGAPKAAPKEAYAPGGGIELGSPYPASSLGLDKTAAGASSGQPGLEGQEPTNWTVAVDLAWNFKSSSQASQAQYEAERIAELKAESKGKSVAMVVQVYSAVKSADGKDENQIQRLMIKNGEVTNLGQQDSQGEAKDLEGLLKLATSQAPSKSIALIVNEDGMASRGLMGDGGHMDLPELNQAVRDGLNGSSHSQLDVLDLDACIMGDTAVVDKSQLLSKHVVASSEVETARIEKGLTLFEGQDIHAVLKDLLENPTMNGGQLADDFVKRANDQEKAEHQSTSGTEFSDWFPANATLAHFDMSKIGDFESSLDKFGAALTEAAKSPANLEQIEESIEGSNRLAASRVHAQHDLKSFVVKIQESVKEGKLKDPDGSIEKSAADLLKEQQQFIISAHLDQSPLYQNQGAFGTFLPDSNFTRALGENNPLSQLLRAPQPIDDKLSFDDQKRYLQNIDDALANLTRATPPDLRSHLDQIVQARKSLGESQNGKEFFEKFRTFDTAVRGLDDDDKIGLALKSQDQAEIGRWSASSKLDSAPGWNAFIDLLQTKEKQ